MGERYIVVIYLRLLEEMNRREQYLSRYYIICVDTFRIKKRNI